MCEDPGGPCPPVLLLGLNGMGVECDAVSQKGSGMARKAFAQSDARTIDYAGLHDVGAFGCESGSGLVAGQHNGDVTRPVIESRVVAGYDEGSAIGEILYRAGVWQRPPALRRSSRGQPLVLCIGKKHLPVLRRPKNVDAEVVGRRGHEGAAVGVPPPVTSRGSRRASRSASRCVPPPSTCRSAFGYRNPVAIDRRFGLIRYPAARSVASKRVNSGPTPPPPPGLGELLPNSQIVRARHPVRPFETPTPRSAGSFGRRAVIVSQQPDKGRRGSPWDVQAKRSCDSV